MSTSATSSRGALPIVETTGDAGKPPWIAARGAGAGAYGAVRETAAANGVATVCEEAHCPNIGSCWADGTATFLLMGRVCTRACRFCNVASARRGEPLDGDEPARVADAVRSLHLRHSVLTSVDRDDLDDGGAAHLAACIAAVKDTGASVEILMPDMSGCMDLVDVIVAAAPHVIAHNIETIERLTPAVRDRRASYETSVLLLAHVKQRAPTIITKSGMMLGVGEALREVHEAIDDLVEAGVDALTLGQYLRPSPRHLPVHRYVSPAEFAAIEEEARRRGMRAVVAGPLVRSSYHAAEMLESLRVRSARDRGPRQSQSTA